MSGPSIGSQRWLGSTPRHGLPSFHASASHVNPVGPSKPRSKTAITRCPAQDSGTWPRTWNHVVLQGGPHASPEWNGAKCSRMASAYAIGSPRTPKAVSQRDLVFSSVTLDPAQRDAALKGLLHRGAGKGDGVVCGIRDRKQRRRRGQLHLD